MPLSSAARVTAIAVSHAASHIAACGDHACCLRAVPTAFLISNLVSGTVALSVARGRARLISLIVATGPSRIKSGTKTRLIRTADISSHTGITAISIVPLTAATANVHTVNPIVTAVTTTTIPIATHIINLTYSMFVLLLYDTRAQRSQSRRCACT